MLTPHIVDLDRASPHNWLVDTIWARVAYHQYRLPLPVHSNWWLLLQDDVNVPESVRSVGYAEKGTVSPWQARRAAWLVGRFLEYREKLEKYVLRVHLH